LKNSTKLIYKVFSQKPKKPNLFNFYTKEQQGVIKAFINKLYFKKGFKTYEIAKALGISTRTVYKTIIKYRDGKKISRKGWVRRIPRYYRHTNVKIKRISIIQKLFYNLLDWIEKSKILDLEAILEGKPV